MTYVVPTVARSESSSSCGGGNLASLSPRIPIKGLRPVQASIHLQESMDESNPYEAQRGIVCYLSDVNFRGESLDSE